MTRLSEEDLIRWIRDQGWPTNEFVSLGIGDDCAVCAPAPDHELVVTTDLLIEGRHFRLETSPPRDLGWKAGAANLSDVAAMGAAPVAVFLAAALPPEHQDVFREIMGGLGDILTRYRTPLAGGDLSAAPAFFLSLTVIGHLPRGTALRRDGARAGDIVCLTGEPGFSGAGLRLLEAGYRRVDEAHFRTPDSRLVPADADPLTWRCLERHLRPDPRLAVGTWLRESGAVTAAIDTSDGIAKDLRQVCAASGVGARLEAAALAGLVRGETVTRDDILGGGEDYELLFTVAPERMAELERQWAARCEWPALHRLGVMVSEHHGRIRLADAAGDHDLPVAGYDHFAG